jgi:hypothetical protein
MKDERNEDPQENPYAPPAREPARAIGRPWWHALIPTLSWIFDRAPGRTTPVALQVAIVLQGMILAGLTRPRQHLGVNPSRPGAAPNRLPRRLHGGGAVGAFGDGSR